MKQKVLVAARPALGQARRDVRVVFSLSLRC